MSADRREEVDDDFPWPRAGDVLFQPADDWVYNGLVWNFLDGSVHAEGFKKAADALVAQVERRDRDHEFLVYPVVFCYRHYLELSLKSALQAGLRAFPDAGTAAARKALRGHGLVRLWGHLRPLLERGWPDRPGDLDAVESVLSQFDEVDGRSDAFRYPTDRNGEPSLSSDLRMHRIDIRNVGEVVTRIGQFLEAVQSAIADSAGWLDEMGE